MNYLKLVMFLGALLLTGCNNQVIVDDPISANDPVSIEQETNRYETKEKIVFGKLSEAKITCREEKNNTIPKDANFDIEFDDEVTQEYVENTFSIKPYKNVTVVQNSPKSYTLKTVDKLNDNQVYHIEEKTTDGVKKWAFQTEKEFKVEYTYPGNNGYLGETGVPEIRFNSEVSKDTPLKDYVTITPSINGEWKSSYSYNYRFEHSSRLTPEQTYTLTIKKGLKDIDGNELADDYTYSFAVQNYKQSDLSANLNLINVYKPDTNIEFTMNLYLNLNKSLTIENAKLRVINLGSKEEFIKASQDYVYIEKIKNYFNSSTDKIVFEKDIKDIVKSEYEKAKSEKRNWYNEEVPLNLNLNLKEQGYYMVILELNKEYTSSVFQVNDTTASCSVIARDNFMFLYKGKDGKSNSVDVYVNDKKLGTTDEDGVLYVEEFSSIIKELNKEFNYVEFQTSDIPLICDISSQIYESETGENRLTSNSKYNNGYVYIDRNKYKPGETVYYWGYAKNRKIDVKNATLRVRANWDDIIAEIPLKLSEVGSFNGEYIIENVDKESYLEFELLIGEDEVASASAEIRSYELMQYNISVESEKEAYLDGEDAIINVKAETYDGTPLKNQEFSYSLGNKYISEYKMVTGTVSTDETGNAVIKIPITLNNVISIEPKYLTVTVLNELIDAEQHVISFKAYPYKNYAEAKIKYIVDDNKYYIDINEHLALDNKTPANDSVRVEAKAYKMVRNVTGQRYNKYTKEMQDIVEYKEVAVSDKNKSFTIDVKDGKGEYKLENYSTDKNCYYKFYAHLITENGKQLALGYSIDGSVYYSSYKTINDKSEYEEVEYVEPKILPELNYSLSYERNDKLKVGDEVYFYLYDEDGKRLSDYSKFEFYTLLVSAEGNKIIRNKGERPHFTFTDKMGANVWTHTICYDTLKAYVPTSYSVTRFVDGLTFRSFKMWSPNEIKLCEEEIKLDVDISFDKEVYSPRDEAIIKIKVSDKGKGIKAGVNLSALDTAFIDANGSSYGSILASVYNQYNLSASYNSTREYSQMATKASASFDAVNSIAPQAEMAMETGMGAGPDDEEIIRDDLRVTAFFQSIVTDEDGYAEIRVKLPDNITEWTIKAQAVSDSYKVFSDEKKIKVSKDFFVSLNFKERYLVGEHFAFDIKSFSKKYPGRDVEYEIEIADENGNVLEKGTISSKVQDVISYKVEKPIEKAGAYKLKLVGTCEGLKDTLIDEIEITDSLFDSTIREDLNINIGDSISIVSNRGYLYILNKDVAKILPTLFEVSHLYSFDRNDLRVISDEVSRILNDLWSGKSFEYKSKYYSNANEMIFKVMDNSSDDARLALRMLATKAIALDDAGTLDKIESKLGEMARLWAKVNINKASLKELREQKDNIMNDSSSFTKEDVLYLSLAFADFGSFEDAEELYSIVENQITKSNENEYELKVILSIKLNKKNVDELYKEYMSNKENMLPENYNFIRLYYIQNALSKNFTPGEIVLNVNGKDEEISVRNIGLTRVLIKGKDTVKLSSKTDNLKFMLEQYKPVDFKDVPSKDYIMSKSYSNKNPNLGEMVEVTLKIDNKKLYEDGIKYGVEIEDTIPNNMTYVEYLYQASSNGYIRRQDGQKLTIGYWNPYSPKWNPDKTVSTIKYKVRVTNSGEQFEPGTILVTYANEIIDGMK